MNANKLSGYYINGNSIYYEPLQIYSEFAMIPFGFDRISFKSVDSNVRAHGARRV